MLALLLVACSGVADTADTADTGEGAEPLAPTLTNVQNEVFTPSCAFSSCHGEGGGAAGLSLLTGLAYAELVAVPAEGAYPYPAPINSIRVVPADPDGSYLIVKIDPASEGERVGDLMPAPAGLDEEHVELVRQWILLGAQDN
ncbi:MAG: hypothetical protein EXR71_07970 [Myxococcales bacterium]|nr:hypothetical protein [Myxococcales bacterium]